MQILGELGIPDPYEAPNNAEIVMDTVNHPPEKNARVIVEYPEGKWFIVSLGN